MMVVEAAVKVWIPALACRHVFKTYTNEFGGLHSDLEQFLPHNTSERA
jgi:hypothetical protein